MAANEQRITPGLYGYLDRFDYRPGGTVAVAVHSDVAGPAEVDVVRLHGSDERVTVVAPLVEPITAIVPRSVPVGPQEVAPGSCAVVEGLDELADVRRLELDLWAFATRPGREQGLVSTLDADGASGVLVGLDGTGRLVVRVGTVDGVRELFRSEQPVPERVWLRLAVGAEAPERGAAGGLSVGVTAHRVRLGVPESLVDERVELPLGVRLGSAAGRLTIAAQGSEVDALGRTGARGGYDGKLEAVTLRADGTTVAAWDFAREQRSDRVVDAGPAGHHGVLHQRPTRAVTGHAWNGRVTDVRLDASQYAAIHFHSDDLDDVAWPAAVELRLPDDLPSGVYGVRVRGEAGDDTIPFFVLPPVAVPATGRPSVAFLAPTFTYQAYANASLGDRIDYVADGISGREYLPGPRDAQLEAHSEVAGSLYDVHADGSGRSTSSQRRPIFNFRADYRSAVQQALRHVGADLYLTTWLEHERFAHDVLTDHLLDEQGVDALDGYRVLVTGSHPEYVSEAMLDALHAFLARGGRIMYLGANGFYWVTSREGHTVETRRGHAGVRTWESEPGELHHAMTGEPGGLWRHRGRAPNELVGIGMASQGWDERAPGFVRSPDSEDPRVSWIFAGVEDGPIGADGLVMGGASGDEIDRYDERLGSPPDAFVVATSQPHSRFYKAVVEDVPMIRDGLGGDENPDVRSDVVCFAVPGGGAVFSVGSISWAGAMAFADYENPVARMTTNVLRRFVDAEHPLTPTTPAERSTR